MCVREGGADSDEGVAGTALDAVSRTFKFWDAVCVGLLVSNSSHKSSRYLKDSLQKLSLSVTVEASVKKSMASALSKSFKVGASFRSLL